MVIVINLDILKDLAPRLGFGSKAVGERKTFGFEAAKEGFNPGVIITVTLSAHALNYPNGPQLFAHRLARVLAAAVGVENETTGRLTQQEGILEGSSYQLSLQTLP